MRAAVRAFVYGVAALWVVVGGLFAVSTSPWVLAFVGVGVLSTFATKFALDRGELVRAIHYGGGGGLLGILGATLVTGGLGSPIAELVIVPQLFALGLGPPRTAALHVAAALASLAVLAAREVGMGAFEGEAPVRAVSLGVVAAVVAVVVSLQRRVYAGIREAAEGRVERAEELARERDTARQGAQAEIARHRAYVATISHELRTPLGGLLGMTSALEGTELDHVQQEIVAAMRTSGRSLHAIVDDMLDYESLDRGRVSIELAPASPDTMIGEVVDLFAPVTHQRGVEIVAEVAPMTPSTVRLDRQRVSQILANLVGNASKFTLEGEISVRAAYRTKTSELVMEVADTGPGIDAARRAHLFEPFAQGDATLARRFGGSGLGMAISKRLAEQMGGSLELVTTGPGGSTFRLVVPAPALEPPPAPSTGAVPPMMLVDGSAAVRAAWAATCLRHGTISTEVATLDEAVEKLGPRHRVVVLDTQSASGRSAIEGLRKRSDHWARVPIVLAVRSTDLDVAREMREAGFVSATTMKPLAFGRVVAAVQQVSATVESTAVKPVEPSRALSVLVVDDDRINRLAARLVLRRLGHEVVEASCGEEGLRLASERAFDVVFLDLHMPDLLGTEVARRLRAEQGASARALLVALTAAAFSSDREECLRAGMEVFLTKPFEPAAMHDVVERAERRARGSVRVEAP